MGSAQVQANKAITLGEEIIGHVQLSNKAPGNTHHPSLLVFFFCHQHGSNSYVASYAPMATALMTTKNPAQILDAYLFPGA